MFYEFIFPSQEDNFEVESIVDLRNKLRSLADKEEIKENLGYITRYLKDNLKIYARCRHCKANLIFGKIGANYKLLSSKLVHQHRYKVRNKKTL